MIGDVAKVDVGWGAWVRLCVRGGRLCGVCHDGAVLNVGWS